MARRKWYWHENKPDLRKVLRPGKSGDVRIEHFTITQKKATHFNFMLMFDGDRRGAVDPGRFTKLIVGDGVMMSDTRMEWTTNMGFLREARGDVLIGGLGLGLIVLSLATKPHMRSITVIEKNPHVLKLVKARIEREVKRLKPRLKLSIVEGDVDTWEPPKGQLFDVIYMDIWPSISADNHEQMKTLRRRYAQWLKPMCGPVTCWREYDVARLAREDRAYDRQLKAIRELVGGDTKRKLTGAA